MKCSNNVQCVHVVLACTLRVLIKILDYAGIMLNAFASLLCPKLCQHNWRKPNISAPLPPPPHHHEVLPTPTTTQLYTCLTTIYTVIHKHLLSMQTGQHMVALEITISLLQLLTGSQPGDVVLGGEHVTFPLVH